MVDQCLGKNAQAVIKYLSTEADFNVYDLFSVSVVFKLVREDHHLCNSWLEIHEYFIFDNILFAIRWRAVVGQSGNEPHKSEIKSIQQTRKRAIPYYIEEEKNSIKF